MPCPVGFGYTGCRRDSQFHTVNVFASCALQRGLSQCGTVNILLVVGSVQDSNIFRIHIAVYFLSIYFQTESLNSASVLLRGRSAVKNYKGIIKLDAAKGCVEAGTETADLFKENFLTEKQRGKLACFVIALAYCQPYQIKPNAGEIAVPEVPRETEVILQEAKQPLRLSCPNLCLFQIRKSAPRHRVQP